ncbi:MAG: hypothetical protein ACK45I_01785 [Bacteroidota bacterium]|jgi:uncharacterized membrane protein
MKTKIITIIGLLTIACMSACYYDKEEELYPAAAVTDFKWSTTIKPIIDVNCATPYCHSASAVSPDLTTYEKVFSNRDRVKARAVTEGTMPKSGPLNTSQRNALAKWIEAGAPNN